VLDGLGTPDAQSADLMSYLLFDAAYTRTLVEIGQRDAGERIDEIEAFLRVGGAAGARRPRAKAKSGQRRELGAHSGPDDETRRRGAPRRVFGVVR
jgi:hypothetical protein